MPGVGDTRPWESASWRKACTHKKLTIPQRTKEKKYQKILDELRVSKPTKATLKQICAGHKAWTGKDGPTADDLRRLFSNHPRTVIVTCTRRAAEEVNIAAINALFPRKSPITTLPGAVDVNPENYDANNQFRTDRRPRPAKVPIYKGVKLYLGLGFRV